MEEITEDYVSRETYKLLKEKGYDGELKIFYDTEGYTYPAIHLYDAMKWLREVRGISIDIITNFEWIRDPMAPSTDIEYPEISEFTGYYLEIHQLVPHRLLYDSPVISKTYSIVCEEAIKYCLKNLI